MHSSIVKEKQGVLRIAKLFWLPGGVGMVVCISASVFLMLVQFVLLLR